MQTRIAPTPSGFLHIGNACSFLLTRRLASHFGGLVRLRIDDMDSSRVRPEYLTDIFTALHLLHIEYEQGPKDVNDFAKNYTQACRLPLYIALLNDLRSVGCIYACTCSRRTMAREGGQCHCRQYNIPLDIAGVAWRIAVPHHTIIQFTDERLGPQCIDLASHLPHFVVRKRDGMPAYHITSVADDMYYCTDYIVRGQDLLITTAAQIFLAKLTGRNSFLENRFFHHPLLTNAQGEKLSKSAGAASVSTLLQIERCADSLVNVVNDWLA